MIHLQRSTLTNDPHDIPTEREQDSSNLTQSEDIPHVENVMKDAGETARLRAKTGDNMFGLRFTIFTLITPKL